MQSVDVTTLPGGVPLQADSPDGTRSARRSPDFYAQLLETAPDGIVVVDADGTILVANRKAELLFGWNRDQLVGRSLEMLVPHRARSGHPRHRSSYVRDPRNRPMGSGLELTALRADGTEFPVDISLSPLITDEGTFVSAAVRDASDRKRTEQELRGANARLQAVVMDLEARSRDMSALSRASQVMQSCARLEEAMQVIARAGAGLFEGVPGGVYTASSDRELLEPVATWEGLTPAEPFRTEDCWALRTGRVHQLGQDALALPCPHVPAGTEWSICVPLIAQTETLGVVHLRVDSRATHGSSLVRIEELATLVRDQWGLTLANIRLRDTLRDQSIRDPLTGLFNRRFLDESLEREMQRARRRGKQLSVAILDLDHFKVFNDTHGHHGGDAVLRHLGRFLLETTRSEDVVARFGGEEFVILFADTSLAEGTHRCELLSEGWQRRAEEAASVLQPLPTLSIGLAEFPASADTVHEVFSAADAALYAAKERGRNRVVAAPSMVEAAAEG
ncbi:MAG TPA: diguanylate cyclase [Mycobacteriales bacterium]|nr:diguanylate cyclase [Mycobacteriales bacterium]